MKEGFAPITLERVQAAYEAADIKPVNKAFVSIIHDDGKLKKCGCAISALMIGEGHVTFEDWLHITGSGNAELHAEKKLGIEHHEFWQFVFSFDEPTVQHEEEWSFVKLGKSCRLALIEGVTE